DGLRRLRFADLAVAAHLTLGHGRSPCCPSDGRRPEIAEPENERPRASERRGATRRDASRRASAAASPLDPTPSAAVRSSQLGLCARGPFSRRRRRRDPPRTSGLSADILPLLRSETSS